MKLVSHIELWDIKSISTWFFSSTYGLMDIIDLHQFIDIGLFLKSAAQIIDACFDNRYKKKQDGTTL